MNHILTHWTFKPSYEKKSDLPDMTIPDQSMSVKEIIDRYARGLPMEAGKVPMYYGDSNFPHNFNQMELTDRMDLLQAHAEKISKKQKEVQEKEESARYKAAMASDVGYQQYLEAKNAEAYNPSLKNSGVQGTESPQK